MAYAYGFASFYFNEIVDVEVFNKRVGDMNFMIAIINTVALVLCLMLIRNRPPTPASGSDVFLPPSFEFAAGACLEVHQAHVFSRGVHFGLGILGRLHRGWLGLCHDCFNPALSFRLFID